MIFFQLILINVSPAQVKLPALVSDSMVLQRNQPIKIWGWAAPNERVAIMFNNQTYKTKTDNSKKWIITLRPMKAGGPYDMQIAASNKIILRGILIGDVWLCSGQSNMEFSMRKVQERYANVIASSDNPMIRQFRITTKKYSFSPQENLTGKWQTANPQNVLDFTAVGYFFALKLFTQYKVPIGLINSSWGGTPIEAWLSEAGLKDFPDYLTKANYFKDSSVMQSVMLKDKQAVDDWFKKAKDQDIGFKPGGANWANNNTDTTAWKKIKLPGFWEDLGEPGLDGVVWARKEINIKPSELGNTGLLQLGAINDLDTTYFNGIKVGTSPSSSYMRNYTVPASLIQAGKNVITVRITNKIGKGGMVYGKPYQFIIANTIISLAGQWLYRVGISMLPMPATTVIWYQPTSMYNGMIAPLIPYTLKGVVWYQGEGNVGKAMEYRKILPDMIADWRRRWNEKTLPFLIVQLPNYMPVQSRPSESNWAILRESQAIVAETVADCGLAVTIDAGEAYDVHPADKKDVGDRLVLMARKLVYGESGLTAAGPVYQSMRIENNQIILSFINTGTGLEAKTDITLHQFAIAGPDKKFVWAKARIEGEHVVVWSAEVTNPVAVRYAWADNPDGCNLYNKEGLPAMPFRTDNWIK